jgi:transcriptional regulator with PAS, ATPase and Fis domain
MLTTEIPDPIESIPAPHADQDLVADLARHFVGTIDLKEAQRILRRAMRDEALRRAAGSRRRAAKLLGVDRRYVQRMLAAAP